MNTISLILLVCMMAVIQSMPKAKDTQRKQDFENFKINNGQNSDLDEETRYKNFVKNADFIDSMNQKHNGQVKFGYNKFSDRDVNTDLKKLTGAKLPSQLSSTILVNSIAQATVSSLDWRTQKIVTPVRDQGYCGSCWAFATLASLESALIRYRNRTLNLSEQNLVDCDLNNFGCNGGYIDYAFNYIKSGIMSESAYPYTATAGTCKYVSSKSVAKVTGYSYFNYESALESTLVSYGPIVTLIEVTDEFYFYTSGVMTGSLCTGGINHAVTVVGFNNTANPPFWIVKNSWGTGWGESGYFRIQKGLSKCDIGLYNYRPAL